MFKRKKSEEQVQAELFREKLQVRIQETEDLKDLTEAMSLMEKLSELKKKSHISPDTAWIVGGNLIGILLILNYERCNVVASKALGFVMRGRV